MTEFTGRDGPERTDQSVVIFKLGGSLLDLPDLKKCVLDILAQRPQSRPLLVVGGGAAANIVRDWDRRHQLGDDLAHEMALLAMGLNEEFLVRLLPNARLVRSARQFDMAIADLALPILCAHCFLKWGESEGHPPLPRSWNITSDSIAAWTARVLGAEELVLMKSVPCPHEISVDEAARQGLVDACFVEHARGIPKIAWCNARDERPVISPWLTGEQAERL